MITHEEALTPLKEIAEKLTRKQWLELTGKIETIRAYISQQEKLQAEHEASNRDFARFIELDNMLYLQGWHSKEETVEYQELRNKLAEGVAK